MASTATKEWRPQRIPSAALLPDEAAALEWSYVDDDVELPAEAEFASGLWRRHPQVGFSSEVAKPSAAMDLALDFALPGLPVERAGWAISALRGHPIGESTTTHKGRIHLSRALETDDVALTARTLTSKVVDQPTSVAARNAVSVCKPAAWPSLPPTILGQGLQSWNNPFSTYAGQSFDVLTIPDVLAVPDVTIPEVFTVPDLFKVPHHYPATNPNKLVPLLSSDLWLDEANRNKVAKTWADLFPRIQVLDLATRVAHHLARIPEMAKAPDSVLPSPEVVAAAQAVVAYLPPSARLPQIEIDDSNGAISLVWRDRSNAFALEIPSARYVIGVGFGTGFAGFQPWRHLVTEERKIITEIQASETVRKLLGSE